MGLWATRRGLRREVARNYGKLCKAAGIERPVARLTRQFFRRQLMQRIALHSLQGSPRRVWDRYVRLEGFDPVRKVLSEGGSVVVASMHFGVHMLSMARLTEDGFRTVIIRPSFMRDIQSPAQRRLQFLQGDNVFVGKEEGAVKPLREALRHLKNNCVLGIAIDGDRGGNPEGFPLFDGEYPLRLGGLELARHANVPVVFALGLVVDHRFAVRYFPVCYPPQGGHTEATLRAFVVESMGHYEATIREFPECVWWWRSMTTALGFDDRGWKRQDAAARGDGGQE